MTLTCRSLNLHHFRSLAPDDPIIGFSIALEEEAGAAELKAEKARLEATVMELEK